jgi:hypothetical protein
MFARNVLRFAAAAALYTIAVAAAPITDVKPAIANVEGSESRNFSPVNLELAGLQTLDRVAGAAESDVFTVPESDTATMILLGALLCGGGVFLKKRFQPATELESGIPGDNTSSDSPFRLER